MTELTNQSELLRELTPDELQRVRAITSVREFAPGETVLRQGDPAESVFVLLAGRVRVTALLGADGEAADAEEEMLVTLGPGDFFGELSFVTGAPPSLSVIAEEPATLAAISQAGLHKLIAEDASTCRKLLFAMVRTLVARLRDTSRELVLSRYFIRGR